MQRDTHFTLEDILGDSDEEESADTNLFDMMGELELSKAAVDPLAIPSDLRFLHLPVAEDGDRYGICCKLKAHDDTTDGDSFMAISYCWDSFERANSTTGVLEAPVVSVIEDGIERRPRCPPDVLLRAIYYARDAKINRIWIDQECINQANFQDVQRHVRCMHEIYAKATIVAGLLNFEIVTNRQLYNLSIVAGFQKGLMPESPVRAMLIDTSEDLSRIKSINRLLRDIVLDRWFSRTWCFQERHSSAACMQLLFPMSPKVRAYLSQMQGDRPNTADLAVPLGAIVFLSARWRTIVEESMSMTIEFEEALKSLHRTTIRFCPLAIGYEQAFELISKEQHDEKDEDYKSLTIFRLIEQCDNRVVADRISIFANVASFNTYVDMSNQRSYSVALLALLLINAQLPSLLVRTDDVDKANLEAFARIIHHRDILHEVLYLRRIRHERHESACNDLAALEEYMQAETQVNLRECESYEDFLRLFVADSDLPLLESRGVLDEQMHNLLDVCVLPLAASVRDILRGVITRSHQKCWSLSDVHGEKLVAYAIAHRQLPAGSKFLCFHGRVAWTPSFVNHFF